MKIIPITDLHTPELEIYNERREVQLLRYYEPAPGLFIAESANVILRALAAGYEPLSLLMEQREADSEKGREVLGRIMEISEQIPAYVSSIPNLRLQAGAWHALCHATENFAEDGGAVPGCQTHRYPGKCGESHECRSNLPLRSSTGD